MNSRSRLRHPTLLAALAAAAIALLPSVGGAQGADAAMASGAQASEAPGQAPAAAPRSPEEAAEAAPPAGTMTLEEAPSMDGDAAPAAARPAGTRWERRFGAYLEWAPLSIPFEVALDPRDYGAPETAGVARLDGYGDFDADLALKMGLFHNVGRRVQAQLGVILGQDFEEGDVEFRQGMGAQLAFQYEFQPLAGLVPGWASDVGTTLLAGYSALPVTQRRARVVKAETEGGVGRHVGVGGEELRVVGVLELAVGATYTWTHHTFGAALALHTVGETEWPSDAEEAPIYKVASGGETGFKLTYQVGY